MKTTPIITICLILASCSLVTASPRVGLGAAGICTNDYNLWGHASQCSCDPGIIYDERSGLCLQGQDIEQITVQGPVAAGIVAIGGETTGFSITSSDNESYELILKTADQQKLSKLSEMWFEVEGELINIESVEIRGRRAIIVEQIAVLE